jgi:hypothetical protein
MGEKDTAEELRGSWQELIADHRAEPLTVFMSKHSGLPGPRGNITLAAEASRLIAEGWGAERRFLHALVEGWASSGDEYLMFTAHTALGYVLAVSPAEEPWAVPILYGGNFSKLWRAREGVTFALEALLDKRRGFALALIDKWCTVGDPIVIRNAIVALAHPSQLSKSSEQLDALKKYNRVGMELVAGSSKAPDLDMLAKSLGFTLSVAAEADEGYLDQFGEWLGAGVKPWKSIVKENLSKARIVKKYPGRVAALRALLG